MEQQSSRESFVHALNELANPTSMPRAVARRHLMFALDELMTLRESTTEWMCLDCKVTYLSISQGVRMTECPVCDSILMSAAVVRILSYQQTIKRRDKRVIELQDVLAEVLDLSIRKEEEDE